MSNLNQICIHKHEIFWINKINSKYYSFVLSVSNKFDVTYIIHIRQTNSIHIYVIRIYVYTYIRIYHPMYYAFKSNLSWHVEENVRLAKIKAPESTYLFLNDIPPTFSFGIANQCLQKICFHFNGKVQNY